jgi:hypothetical protein
MRRSLSATLLLSTSLYAQQSIQPKPHHTPTADSSAKEPEHNTSLPVTRVSLYKNGVGFFEHTGHINGNAAVTIDFTSGQLNDVLQSLTAIDLNGGRISGADYNSTTPLDQQLKNLPLALSSDPTSLDFYAAIRGTRVEVHSGSVSITGRLLAVESRNIASPSGDDSKPLIEHQFITVVADNGETRSLELTPATSVRLLDTALHTDVTRYLQLLDANRSQGLRHLTLQDNGTGSRELRLSYISEVPIWKSTYRILFTDKNPSAPSSTGSLTAGQGGVGTTATFQGWSVVDNTTGADWINVQLSLIAGAPQSFIQPLSQPIYSRRPEIPIAQEAQLTPQTFDSSIESDSVAQTAVVGFNGGGLPQSKMAMAAPMAARSLHGSAGGLGSGSGMGIGPGSGGNMGGGVYAAAAPAPPAESYEDIANESLAPATKTSGFDDFFAYNLTEPVTIRKNESALVPILQAKVKADRVTLVTSNGNATSQPLRALWLTNTSGLTLDRGSFSIVENGNFGGEGLLDPIHPDEKRLLSYAADQAVHVSTEGGANTSHVTYLRGSKGILNIHHANLHEITYAIHNSASDTRTVILEHPIEQGLKLDNLTPTPTETTATVNRFRVEVAPGATRKIHVGGERDGYTTYHLINSNDNQFDIILRSANNNPSLVTALQPILDARRRVADAQLAVDQTTKRIADLRSDEDRQRANITALANADKSSRDRFVHDLNATEDSIAAAQKDLTTRTSALDAAKADLSARIDAFQIDTK